MQDLSRRSFLESASALLAGLLAGRAQLGDARHADRSNLSTSEAGSGRGPLAAPADLAEAIAQSGQPNLVLFVVDDLGWADVGYHGDEALTPNIDTLAAEGVELDRFYSYPVCSPTRAGLLTGRAPLRVGVTQTVKPEQLGLPLEEHLLSETLRAAGYQTWICGKWHLGGEADPRRQPQARGFDHFYGFLGGSIEPYSKLGGESKVHDWQRNGMQVYEEGYCTFLLADESVKLIRERDPARPFLLYLPFHNVHTPLRAPQEYEDRFSHIADRRRRTLLAMCATVDDAIGQVLSALDEAGLREDTLVLFMSDNGGNDEDGGASNAPLRGAKNSMYEGGIRVPAALSWPGRLPAGQRSQQFLAVWDLFPTLCAALGVTPQGRAPLDGRDRWTTLREGEVVDHEPIVIAKSRRDAAVLHGRWKLLESRDLAAPALYDILDDPGETTDLADQHREIVLELQAHWAALQAAAPTPEPTLAASATPDGQPTATPSPTRRATRTPEASPTTAAEERRIYLPRLFGDGGSEDGT